MEKEWLVTNTSAQVRALKVLLKDPCQRVNLTTSAEVVVINSSVFTVRHQSSLMLRVSTLQGGKTRKNPSTLVFLLR
jgi:hypothetical protein